MWTKRLLLMIPRHEDRRLSCMRNYQTYRLHEAVYFKGEADGISVEVAFQFTNEFRENVLGFCNNIYNAEGGTHLTGFKTTFTTVMNTYAREIGVLKDKDPNFTGADIRNESSQRSPDREGS